MRVNIIKFFLILVIFTVGNVFAKSIDIEKSENSWIVSGKNYSMTIDSKTGGILSIVSEGKDSGISVSKGLWSAEFTGGKRLNASEIEPTISDNGNRLFLKFLNDEIDVEVEILPKETHCDFKAKLKVKKGELLKFYLPSTFEFKPECVGEISLHSKYPQAVGLSLQSGFFKDNSNNKNSDIYSNGSYLGSLGFKRIYGFENYFSQKSKPESVSLGKDFSEWFPDLAKEILLSKKYNTSRNFGVSKPEIEILNCSEGVFWGGTRMGGKGAFFNIGGFLGNETYPAVVRATSLMVRKLQDIAKSEKSKRNKLALIKLSGMKRHTFARWDSFFKSKNFGYVELTTPSEIFEALRNPEILFIVNPYSEMCPHNPDSSADSFFSELENFVKSGGHWLECEGVPFFKGIKRKSYFSINSTVPSSAADFFHLQMNGGKIAYFSIQNIKGASFENSEKSFTASEFDIGGSESGGYLNRPFVRYLKSGEQWRSPTVRLSFGKSLQASAGEFCKSNGVTKKLSQKMDPDLLEKFKGAVMFNIPSKTLSATKKLESQLPANNLIHLANYMRGGFDKQYPDHFPVNESFSTDSEFKAYLTDLKSRGHLYMPYTNHSWWCDNPKGSTFLEKGDSALSLDSKGKHYREGYSDMTGWTICMWHSDVRQANDKLVQQCVKDYPCDILFQDQMGARASRLDFNPAAGNPNRYIDGIIFTTREDSKHKPLSTENGWWGIANEEVQFCGMSFGIKEDVFVDAMREYIWEKYPKDSVSIANVFCALFHDKVSISHHDLASGISNHRQLSLSLGIGYTLMYHPAFWKFALDGELAFAFYLDKLQKSLVSNYIGEKMKSFKHKWKNVSAKGSEGYIRSQYGDVKIFASMDSNPIEEGSFLIAPDGFIAESANVKAGYVLAINGIKASTPTAYVIEESDTLCKIWIKAKTGSTLIFPLNSKLKALKLPTGKTLDFIQKDGVVSFLLPLDSDKNRTIFSELIADIEN